jgi:hypothetical protein
MKPLLLICLFLAAIFASGAEKPAPLSGELVEFLADAEFVIVCEKREMNLVITEVMMGNKKTGAIQATFEKNAPEPFRIDPSETWTDLLVWLPKKARLAYYRITNNKVEWFDAKQGENRTVAVESLRHFLSEKKRQKAQNADRAKTAQPSACPDSKAEGNDKD